MNKQYDMREHQIFTIDKQSATEKKHIKVDHHIFTGARFYCIIAVVVVMVCLISSIMIYASRQNLITSSSKSERSLSQPWENIRLPDWLIPITYNISLDVDMDNNHYDGKVVIKTFVQNTTSLIILHQLNLTITNVFIEEYSLHTPVNVKNQSNYEPFEYFVIEVNSALQEGKLYLITLSFKGNIKNDLSGFSYSYYQMGGQKQKVASTFFSPISARKAFPCFDEPKFKANFTLTLTHSSKYHALGNMPVQNQINHTDAKTVTTTFYPSLKMSTYIVCWVIFQFPNKELTKQGVTIKTWAANDQLEETAWGLQKSRQILDYLENYFQIPFPLKKLDMVVIPNLAPGAMENWGLMTFRASRLLVSEKRTSKYEKQRSFQLMAHELAHQWFGNLATMKFWTDAWLKEGFANYISIYAGDKIDKSMEFKKLVLTDLMIPAMKIDSYASSHPISTSANTPNEIREIFDTITYNKGNCMVQMLLNYLGEDHFRKGLQRYLTTYSYKNADQDDLWEELRLVSRKDIKGFMDTWTLQMGFPVISVTRINTTHIYVKQEKYSLDSPDTVLPPSPFNYTWNVPVMYRNIRDNATGTRMLTTKAAEIEVSGDFILNPNHVFYYRVNYDRALLNFFKETLLNDHEALSVQDRSGLISDTFSMVSSNLTAVENAMDMTKYLRKETDFYPWKVGLQNLMLIYDLTDDPKIKGNLRNYISDLTSHLVSQIGFKTDNSVNRGFLQELLLQTACRMGAQDVIANATALYRDWMNGTVIEGNLRKMVRNCAIRNGPDEFWEYAHKKFSEGGSEKFQILRSMTYTRNTNRLKQMLNWTLDDKKINSQYRPDLLIDIALQSKTGHELAWSLVKKNWNYLLKRYGNELFLWNDLLSSVISKFATKTYLNDIENFFSDKTDLGNGKQAIRQSLNEVKARIRWKQVNEASLKEWLIRHKKKKF